MSENGRAVVDDESAAKIQKSTNGIPTNDTKIKLDVPSDKAQQRRKQVMLEGMLRDRKPPKTFRLEASSLLSKVKDFLPQIQQANQKLESMSKDEVAEVVVDNVPDESEAYVEMNLCMYSDSESSDAESEVLGDLLESNCELKPSKDNAIPLVEVVVDKDVVNTVNN